MTRTPEPVTPGLLRGMPLPAPGGSKKSRGDVLVVGGARKTPGAAALTGLAALRVGAGRLTVAVAESVAAPLAATFLEAGVIGLPETAAGGVRGASVGEALEGETDGGCVVIGPGLDDPDETAALLRTLLPALGRDVRVVLDAFALGALAQHPELGEPVAGRLLLTPNGTEGAMLLGRDPADPADDAAAIASRYDAVVVLERRIAEPDGTVREVPAGGPGLGTSGSGDVLAGAIAGLVARGAGSAEAGCWGTYLHSTAGDRLVERTGPLGFLARELLDELPRIMRATAGD